MTVDHESQPPLAVATPARSLTFVVGTGRSGSTALSRILHRHPEVLSLNELFASLSGGEALPQEPLTGEEFWRTILAAPNQFFDGMTRSGVPLPEFLYNRRPGRFSAETTGIPALCLMVLPQLTERVDATFDALAREFRELPRQPVPQLYEALFAMLSKRFGGRAVVERSGYSVHSIPALRAAFPHARFVHLFRDGPDCAVSMSRHIGYRSIVVLRTIFDRTGVDGMADLTPELVRTLPPDLAAVLDERFDPALLLERPMPVTDFGALWSELVTEGVELLDQLPPELHTGLSYEELLRDPHEQLTRLARFLGVPAQGQWLTESAAMLDGARTGAADQLPAEERAVLEERCAPGMRVLGRAS